MKCSLIRGKMAGGEILKCDPMGKRILDQHKMFFRGRKQ